MEYSREEEGKCRPQNGQEDVKKKGEQGLSALLGGGMGGGKEERFKNHSQRFFLYV